MHCWVNKGAKGIALIDEDNAHGKRLKYVFDVSDVHAARRIGRYPEKWEVHEEHKDAVIDRLEQIYGGTDERSPFEERLIEISRRIAEDCYEELLPDLQYLTEGSFLEGLDEQNIGIRFRETLADSISFTLLSACGADIVEYKFNLSITGDIEGISLHIANDLLLFIFIRVVHSGLPFVIQNGDNQGICKKRHGRRNLRFCKCYYIC